ncbi:MAG: hypothetical protein JJ971_04620 [Balneolaceae bacterium]|nr:hypothetical protein [Balneolaceae bacterium]MBO6545659.1 hypothetical protein [Balneolaceae bacterium]MBO6647055.1 hypothetical protein [Balneolaceae bacterium]
MNRIDYYGILGYGIDIVDSTPKTQLINYTYDKKQAFTYNNEIFIPDQFIYDPTPIGSIEKGYYTQLMTNSKEQQNALAGQVGIDKAKIKGLEFSGVAEASNNKYKKVDESTVRQYVDDLAYYTILNIKAIDYENNLTDNVKNALASCTDKSTISQFYSSYGTYVLRSAQIGGQMHIQTSLSITSSVSKNLSQAKVDISAEASKEDEKFVHGGLGFSNRDWDLNSEYLKNSKVSISLIGGNVTAEDSKTWIATLKESIIPTQEISGLSLRRFHAPHFACHISSDPNQYLGLINLKYIPIYEILGLSEDQKTLFKEVFDDFLSGVNPFNDDVKRFIPSGITKEYPNKKGDKETWGMRGWMATYESWAAYEGKPGSSAIVKCQSDAESGGKTEATIYAGETVKLRDKTAYLSSEMYFWFDSETGDSDGTVYTENKLVDW